MERFTAHLQLAEPDPEKGTISGVAAVFDREFETMFGPTVIERGAFAESLKARPNVVLLWQHDSWSPIGRTTELEERKEGLRVTARIADTGLGRDALTLMRDEIIRDLSIGFDPVTLTEGKNGKPRVIHKVDLKEISLVTWGAASPVGARVFEVNRQERRSQNAVLAQAHRAIGAFETILKRCPELAAQLTTKGT